jgi:hypothetical protein
MKTITPTQRRVANIKTARFQPFVIDGEPLPLQSVLQLDDMFPPGVGFHIYRMEPGAVSQPHEHTCNEQFLVLEGELIDNDGTVYRTGDFVLLETGTQHSSHTKTGCTLAVFIQSAETNL